MTTDIELLHQGELSERRILLLLQRLENSETLINRMASMRTTDGKHTLRFMRDDCINYLMAIEEQDDE